jgi:hypothetical protein
VAVARILGDGRRVRTAVFERLVSHHLELVPSPVEIRLTGLAG